MIHIFARACMVLILLTIAPASIQAAANQTQQLASSSLISVRSNGAPVVRSGAATACPNPYIVRRGDTLSRIAARCGISIASLKKLNGLRSNTIRVGQALITKASRTRKPVVIPPPVAPAHPAPPPTPTIESTVSPW